MAYSTAVIVQFTVSKQLITCPCDSYVIQRTYPLIISWHAEFEQWSPKWCSYESVAKSMPKQWLLPQVAHIIYILWFFTAPTSVMIVCHCEGDWASLAIHYQPLWNIVYIWRLNVAAWIPDAPPLILSRWDITASRGIKTWLMARLKSSHPVTTCQFKSMWWGLAMLQHSKTFWRIW